MSKIFLKLLKKKQGLLDLTTNRNFISINLTGKSFWNFSLNIYNQKLENFNFSEKW